MKFKRLLLGVGLSVTMIFSTFIVSYAIQYDDITATDASVSLYGYVDFVEGKLWLRDQVFYNARLSGADSDYVTSSDKTVYVTPGSNDDTLSKVYLYDEQKYVSKSPKTGYGGSYGVLKMKCYDASTTLYGY